MKIIQLRYPTLSLFLFLLFSFGLSSYAQKPSIKILGEGKNEGGVKLNSLHIEVQVAGNIATTVMTMSFLNTTSKVLEGELTFPMPDGVSISRYALDINGEMREAVPVEKAKATEVFESIERRRVDPGLLEKVEGNNFRTRIYPFPAGGTRTVTIGYEQVLQVSDKQVFSFHLPLDYKAPIPKFKLKVSVLESSQQPILAEQPDGSFSFNSKGNTYVASMERNNFTPKRGLTLNLPKANEASETLMQQASGNHHYFLSNVFIKEASRPHRWSNHIGLIWDVSLGGLQRDTKKELEILDALIKEKKDLTIELGLLNHTFKNGGAYTIINGNWEQLRKKLESLVYDGGTDYSKISDNVIKGSEYLFFTDGFSGFGPQQVALNRPVYTINSSLKADYSNLKHISARCGGKFINLNELSVKEAVRQLSRDDLQFIGIKSNPAITELYPSVPVSVNGSVAIAGITGRSNTNVVLQFGYGTEVLMEHSVTLKASGQAAGIINVSKIWAQKKLAEMDVNYEDNKEEISDLGKQFGLITRNTSLLVLENVNDYIRYNIVPPAALRQAYDQIKKERKMEQEEQKSDLIKAAISMAAELKTWWNTDFKPRKTYPKAADAIRFPAPVVAHDREIQSRNEVAKTSAREDRFADSQQLSEVVVVQSNAAGYLRGRVTGVTVKNAPASGPEIIVPEFKSDKEYMKGLNDSPAEVYQEYLKLRKTYQTTPSFYFDMANWFHDHKDADRGLMILSNLTELDLENSDIYKTLTYKLRQTGNFKTEIFTSKKIMQWRPMEAQSYRDYALALADGGYYQKALDMLYSVLTQSYNAEIQDRDNGIEEIIISEINNLIALHGAKLNTGKLNKKLIQPLPVDVRVVLNWNKNDTDIDLWVTDPNGERCYYDNKRTTAGGRISDDFTSGYGPEQFMIRKAIKGEYKIQVNYYGDNQITISGATTVMAEIYTHYGSKNQQRKVIALQLSGKKEDGVLIGTFSF